MRCSHTGRGRHSSVLRFLHLFSASLTLVRKWPGNVMTWANCRKTTQWGLLWGLGSHGILTFGNIMVLRVCERLTGNWFWNQKERVQSQLRHQEVWRVQCQNHDCKMGKYGLSFLFCHVGFTLGRCFHSLAEPFLGIVYFHISNMVCWILPRRRKVAWCGKILTSDYKSLCIIKKSSRVAIQSE